MKRKIFADMLLNIFATAIPIVFLQLWILPSLSQRMPDTRYGLMVTVVSFFNVLPGAAGNVLNNIRLIYAKNDEVEDETANFSVLLLIMFLICLISTFLISYSYDREISIFDMVFNIVTAVLFLIHEYYIVAFRLKINYVRVIVSNIFLAVGYVIGYGLFRFSGYWQLVYIIGYVLSVIYIMCKSTLWKEPLRVSRRFKQISIDTVWLMLAGILGRIVTYADKLLLFPILGGGVVAVYYAASVFGKVISMAISPISSVMLTYLSKVNKKNNSMFFLTLVTGTITCILGYILCMCLSRPVLGFLYPQYMMESMRYIGITTGIAVMQTLISLVTPFVIRFFDTKWQIVVNGGNALVYVVLCMVMLNQWGLHGFCLGALLASVIKLCLLIFVYLKCSTRLELPEEADEKK